MCGREGREVEQRAQRCEGGMKELMLVEENVKRTKKREIPAFLFAAVEGRRLDFPGMGNNHGNLSCLFDVEAAM